MNTPITTVMIIDDNAVDLYIASRMIKKNQIAANVLEYNSAFEALAYLHQHRDNPKQLPQVIFVDIYMPQMSGFEFMEHHNDIAPALSAHCRVYILSSSIDNNDIIRTRTIGNACKFLVKPITKELLDRIREGNL